MSKVLGLPEGDPVVSCLPRRAHKLMVCDAASGRQGVTPSALHPCPPSKPGTHHPDRL